MVGGLERENTEEFNITHSENKSRAYNSLTTRQKTFKVTAHTHNMYTVLLHNKVHVGIHVYTCTASVYMNVMKCRRDIHVYEVRPNCMYIHVVIARLKFSCNEICK